MDDFLVSVLGWAAGIFGGLGLLGLLLWKLKILRKVTVQEATAVAFKYMGPCQYVAMQFSGHHFDECGFVRDGDGPNGYGGCWCIWRIGGWVFYLHPFVEPAKYSDQNDPDNFGDGISVHLNDRTTSLLVSDQKTIAPENVGLNVTFVAIARVTNPFLWLFRSPKDVKSQIDQRIVTALRLWIANLKQEEIQMAKGNGVQLWDSLMAGGFQSKVTDALNWGLEIKPNSIAPEKVQYSDPKYAAALEAASQATLLADAEVAKISAIDKAMDRWVEAQAQKMGKTVAEALVVLKADGSWQRQRDIYMSQILADANANLLLVGNPDGTPIAGDLAPAIALFAAAGAARAGGRQGNRGKGSGNSGGTGGGQGGGQPSKSDEQSAQDFANSHGGKYPRWDPLQRKPQY